MRLQPAAAPEPRQAVIAHRALARLDQGSAAYYPHGIRGWEAACEKFDAEE